MNKVLTSLLVLMIGSQLTACTSHGSFAGMGDQMSGNGSVSSAPAGGPVGGHLTMAMNEDDKYKMFHALDKAPGKSTEWFNVATGTTYIVTPVKKTVVNGNSLCRMYTMMARNGANQQQLNGTACVEQDGNWHAV